MPQRELIGPNAPQHATLPLSGQEVIHAVQNGESVVIFPEDIVPESAAPTAHAASHASNGADPITPASIGAATVDALAVVSEALDVVDAELADLDARVDDIEALPTTPILYALKPAAEAVGVGGYHQGAVAGFIASAAFRLQSIPTGNETVAGNRPGSGTTGGWGIGVSALGFVATAARESDGALQSSAATGLLAFSSYTTAELLTRVWVISIRVTATEMRVFVDDVLAQAVPLAGGYRPATTTRLAVHRNSDTGPAPYEHASAAEFCAAYYVDPTINALGGYADAHIAALCVGAVNNGGVYTGISGDGDVFAVNAMVDGDPYSGINDTCGTPSASSLFVLGTAPHRGRGLAPRLGELGAAHAARADNPHGVTAAQVGAATTGDLAAVSTVASGAATAASTAQTTANAALPKPGGTTTANGIAYGTGTTGAAVAISTTTIADLEPKSAVQTAHSGATRTLADADHNKHQVLSTATELRIPTTLTPGLAWTGRMSGANPVTFAVGGGCIPIEFLGKNTATLAGTRIFVFVESATLATVTIVEKVP